VYTAFTYITMISIWSMHPEVLVDTQWVEDHLKDSNVRIAEVDYDPKANYQLGHVPGAILLDWILMILLLRKYFIKRIG
jgi:3-mercaptopyruvate sulfurtransferase SseA